MLKCYFSLTSSINKAHNFLQIKKAIKIYTNIYEHLLIISETIVNTGYMIRIIGWLRLFPPTNQTHTKKKWKKHAINKQRLVLCNFEFYAKNNVQQKKLWLNLLKYLSTKELTLKYQLIRVTIKQLSNDELGSVISINIKLFKLAGYIHHIILSIKK